MCCLQNGIYGVTLQEPFVPFDTNCLCQPQRLCLKAVKHKRNDAYTYRGRAFHHRAALGARPNWFGLTRSGVACGRGRGIEGGREGGREGVRARGVGVGVGVRCVTLCTPCTVLMRHRCACLSRCNRRVDEGQSKRREAARRLPRRYPRDRRIARP